MGQVVEFEGPRGTMGDKACQLLSIQEVEQFWPVMATELRTIKHLWEMWWTEDAIQMQTFMGNMQVWVAGKPPAFNLVVFTQIIHYPASSILQAVLMFGNKVDEVLPVVVETLEYYAVQHGCKYAEIFGRPGWKKKLSSHGFRETSSVLVKPLGELRRH